jgi:ribose transport system substrate-binding protein
MSSDAPARSLSRRQVVALAAACAALLAGCGAGDGPAPGVQVSTAKPLVIAVIPKGTTHEFWKTVHAGVIKAERELNAAGTPVKIIWKGPLKEDDRASQIDTVQGFIAQGVSGIVLMPPVQGFIALGVSGFVLLPLDRTALVAPVELAVNSRIPVVIADSALESTASSSYIATHNREGGRIGGKRLGELLGGKGKVILLRYMEGSASTEEREEGFMEAIAAFPGITVISSNAHAGATQETALAASQNLINRFKNEVEGVFCPCEPVTTAITQALTEQGLNKKVKVVGFDNTPRLVEWMRAGDIHGLVLQDPLEMGYLAVKAVVAAAQGKEVAKRNDMAPKLVTPENMEQPQFKALLDPPLAEYLGK